jgi:putative acetyltransferase
MEIRLEKPGDVESIRQITLAAFETAEHSTHTEARIVDALRHAGALTVSLVAVVEGEVVGHLAFSPVTIDGADHGWYGVGPVSVRPDRQRRGIGQALIHEGIHRLGQAGARGCVVLGEPSYYRRFGFENDPGLRLEGVPAEYFMRLSMAGASPTGLVRYHEGFNVL